MIGNVKSNDLFTVFSIGVICYQCKRSINAYCTKGRLMSTPTVSITSTTEVISSNLTQSTTTTATPTATNVVSAIEDTTKAVTTSNTSTLTPTAQERRGQFKRQRSNSCSDIGIQKPISQQQSPLISPRRNESPQKSAPLSGKSSILSNKVGSDGGSLRLRERVQRKFDVKLPDNLINTNPSERRLRSVSNNANKQAGKNDDSGGGSSTSNSAMNAMKRIGLNGKMATTVQDKLRNKQDFRVITPINNGDYRLPAFQWLEPLTPSSSLTNKTLSREPSDDGKGSSGGGSEEFYNNSPNVRNTRSCPTSPRVSARCSSLAKLANTRKQSTPSSDLIGKFSSSDSINVNTQSVNTTKSLLDSNINNKKTVETDTNSGDGSNLETSVVLGRPSFSRRIPPRPLNNGSPTTSTVESGYEDGVGGGGGDNSLNESTSLGKLSFTKRPRNGAQDSTSSSSLTFITTVATTTTIDNQSETICNEGGGGTRSQSAPRNRLIGHLWPQQHQLQEQQQQEESPVNEIQNSSINDGDNTIPKSPKLHSKSRAKPKTRKVSESHESLNSSQVVAKTPNRDTTAKKNRGSHKKSTSGTSLNQLNVRDISQQHQLLLQRSVETSSSLPYTTVYEDADFSLHDDDINSPRNKTMNNKKPSLTYTSSLDKRYEEYYEIYKQQFGEGVTIERSNSSSETSTGSSKSSMSMDLSPSTSQTSIKTSNNITIPLTYNEQQQYSPKQAVLDRSSTRSIRMKKPKLGSFELYSDGILNLRLDQEGFDFRGCYVCGKDVKRNLSDHIVLSNISEELVSTCRKVYRNYSTCRSCLNTLIRNGQYELTDEEEEEELVEQDENVHEKILDIPIKLHENALANFKSLY
jgi:hypothetical protein